MSYIGKNPEADSVKLKGSATEPSGTAVDGQVYFNTGTGSISKGMKVYKNSQFVAIDKQLGDAETMQLLKAADIPAIDFSLSVTSTTVGGNNAVPFEGTSGDFDGTAAFTNSSTGDALLTDDSADLVFHYTTQATNSADNDFWGIPLTVPRAFRGGNLVLEFKYRTEIATGTMDDGYFNIAIQDRSSMILQTQKATTSGAIAAGANVELTGKTYANPVTGTTLTVAVGDRVFVESGTGTAGSQDNDIVEAYITEVSGTDNNVKLSKDIVAVGDGKFVTGWLTGYDTGGQIDAFASDTNKDGTTKKLAFKTDADTQQISLWFFVKGTSTVKHELFFDNVLLSGNKFLQASSQLPQIVYAADQPATNSYADNTGVLGLSDALMTGGAMEFGSQQEFDSYMTISGSPTKFQVNKDCEIHFYFSGHTGTANRFLSLYKNTTTISADGYFVGGANVDANGSSSFGKIDTHFKFKAGDFFSLAIGDMGGGSTATMSSTSQRCQLRIGIKPVQSDVILLESQDEIFTDWNDWTPSFDTANWAAGGANNVRYAKWRRIGSDMEVKLTFQVSTGTVSGNDALIPLPSGYSVDIASAHESGTTDGQVVGKYIRMLDTQNFYNSTSGASVGIIYIRDDGKLGFSYAAASDNEINTTININDLSDVDNSFYVEYKVPIAGWNANFNPLLSLPLVDLGTPAESYKTNSGDVGSFWDSGTGNSYLWDEALLSPVAGSPPLASSSLITIADKTSGTNTVTAITAKQDIILSISMTKYINTGSNVGFYWGGTDTSLTLNQAAASSQYHATSWSGKLSAGDYIYAIGQAGPGASTGRVGGASISAQKLMSGNMAHIIKPAVATAKAIFSSTTVNPVGSSSTGFVNLPLNTFEGETWFLTPGTGSLGVGGTNTDFTLEPGTYKIISSNPQYNCGNSANRLVGGSTFGDTYLIGQTGYSDNNYNTQVFTQMSGVLTLTSTTSFRVQSNSTVTATNAFGVANTELNSVYLQLTIEKLK